MNSRDDFSIDKAPRNNNNGAPIRGDDLSGASPVHGSSNDAASHGITQIDLFSDTASQNSGNPKSDDSQSVPVSPKAFGNVAPNLNAPTVDVHFKKAGDISEGIANNTSDNPQSNNTARVMPINNNGASDVENTNAARVMTANSSTPQAVNRPTASAMPVNGLNTSPVVNMKSTRVATPNGSENASHVTNASTPRTIPAYNVGNASPAVNPNTTRILPPNGTTNNPPVVNATPTRTIPANKVGNASPVVNPNATRVVPPYGAINNVSRANTDATRVMPVNGAGKPSTVGVTNPTKVMPKTGNVSSTAQNNVNPFFSGAERSAAAQNPNNATRVIPRTAGTNINQVNNNATRIMPGVPGAKPVSGYDPSVQTTVRNIPNNINPTNNGATPGKSGPQNDNNGKTVLMNNIRSNVPNSKTTLTPAVRPGTVSAKPPVQNNTEGKKKKVKKSGSPWIGVLKFVLYISFVIIVSVLLAKYFISVGNDMFAFVKDSYDFTDTVYSVKGEAANALRITHTDLSGDRFEFTYAFKDSLSEAELDALDASCILINTTDNSIVHNFGKYTDDVIKNNPIVIDLANSDMGGDVYLLRFTVNTGNNISYITEFTLSKKSVNINIKQNASAKEVAKLLKEKGLINHPGIFKMYIKLKTDDDEKAEFVSGDQTLYLGMDYDEILSAITPRRNVRSIVKLTFPEGSTVDDIIDILIKGGVKNSKQDYIDAINNYADFDYRFIDLLEQQGFSNDRVYALEGYLFPDTYEFYTDASPKAVLDKFLSNFDAKFDASFYDEAEKLGLTVDEIVSIASLVEAEAGNPEDKGNISSVFHNRLNNAGVYPYLESDATTDYASYDLRSVLKLTDYKCKKCGEKDVKAPTKCSNCGNNNSYEEYKCASFRIDLSKYALKDGVYYINFNVRTDVTRSVALIDITKKTSAEKAVYSIGSKTASDSPVDGDMKVVIENASVDANGILTCEFRLDHGFSSEEFMKFPIKLDLFRKAYNTYLTPGLMPGAVTNPGYESIISALYPNNTNYYFFVADNTGNSHFSTTNEEHNATIADLERNGKSVTAN